MVDFTGAVFGSTGHPATSSRLANPADPDITFTDNVSIIMNTHPFVVSKACILSCNGRSLTDLDLIDSYMEGCILTMEVGRNAVENRYRFGCRSFCSWSRRSFASNMFWTENTNDSINRNFLDRDAVSALILAKEKHMVLAIVMIIDGNMTLRAGWTVSPDADITGLKLGRKTNVLHKIQDSIGGSLIGDVFDITSLAAMNGFSTIVMLHDIGCEVPAVMMEMVVPIVQVISIKI